LWDEIVVAQEPQITPVYGMYLRLNPSNPSVLRISTSGIAKLLANWDMYHQDPNANSLKPKKRGKNTRKSTKVDKA